jgi:hypothetical protein
VTSVYCFALLYFILLASFYQKHKKLESFVVVFTCVGDMPNRYTSDVVLNQQARVAHQGWYGGFAIPGGPVVEIAMAVLDAGAYGGSGDKPMADLDGPWRVAL